MVLDPRVVGGHPVKTYLTNTCSANNAAGPFEFVCQNKSSSPTSFYKSGTTPTMTVVPNPHYYGPKPHIKIVIPTIATDQTAYADYLSGHLDETTVPSAYVSQQRGKEKRVVLAGVEYLTPNEDTAPFNNVHCRLAVAYAIDRNSLFNKVMHGTGIPIYDVVPLSFLGAYPGNDNPHYNPTEARAQLKQCPGGIHNVQLTYQHTTTDYDTEYSAIEGMLSAVGIGIKLKPLTHNDWLNIVGATSLQSTHTIITQNDYYEDYPDPQDYCTLLLHSGSAYDIGDYRNKTYDHLVDLAEVTPNKAKRAALYRQAQHIALSDGAWISLQNFVQYNLLKPYVHGLVSSPAYSTLWAKGDNWANVTISKH
jgi:ABC-type oligopeptide transport system substrate-binding subunit